jgi:hypothetical protein
LSVGLATRGYLGGLATRGYEMPTVGGPSPDVGPIAPRGTLAPLDLWFGSLAIADRIVGALEAVGVEFGYLEIADPVPIQLADPIRVNRSESLEWTLTVTDDADAPVDLTGSQIELEVKVARGDGDPAKIRKIIGAGVTLLAQTGDTLGMATIVIDSSDTEDKTAMPAGIYWLDVVRIAGGKRKYVIPPLRFVLDEVVNDA